MNKYLESGELTRGRDHQGHPHAHDRRRDPSDAVRQRVQEQGRAAHARRGHRLHAVADRHSAGSGHRRRRQAGRAARRRQREVLGAGVQADDRPVRRPADVRARLFGRAEVGRLGLQSDPRQEGAHRPDPADAREPARGDQGDPGRRHRRLRRAARGHDRRDAVRSAGDHHAREDGVPRAGHLAGRRAEDQGRPGEDGHRAGPAGPGRPVVPRQDRRGVRPDHHLRDGRAAPRNHRRPHEARVRRRGQRRQAAGRLPRDDPQAGLRRRRQVRPPVGRQGPVRPRRAEDRAAGAGQGLRVRRRDQGRRRAARVHPGGQEGRRGFAAERACSPAIRSSTSRSR